MRGRRVMHTRPVVDIGSPLHRKPTSTNKNGVRFEATAETSTEGYNHLNENKGAESTDTHVHVYQVTTNV